MSIQSIEKIVNVTGYMTLVIVLSYGQILLGQGRFPERAFEVEGGSIGIQAGVMKAAM